MQNLGGCGALVGFAAWIGVVLLLWTSWGQFQDAGVSASLGRWLVWLTGVAFVATLAAVVSAPMGKGR